MDPLITGAALTSAAGLAGQAITNARNMKLAKYQNQQNIKMWERQNLYNSPAEQMKRLKAAGLNPNLVYGTGAVGNTSGAAPRMERPEFNLDTQGLGSNVMTAISQKSQLAYQDAQTKNVQADTLNKQTENANKIVTNQILQNQAIKLGIDIDKLRAMNPLLLNKLQQDIAEQGLDITIKSGLAPYQTKIMENKARASELEAPIAAQEYGKKIKEIQLLTTQVEGRRTENELKAQEVIYKKMENAWMEKGITTKDALPVRVIADYLQKNNIKPETIEQSTARELINILESLEPDWFKKSYEEYRKRATPPGK